MLVERNVVPRSHRPALSAVDLFDRDGIPPRPYYLGTSSNQTLFFDHIDHTHDPPGQNRFF